MHREVLEWLDSAVDKNAASVIEIGALNVNGSPRIFFQKAVASGKYLGVDIAAGEGVDVVADAAKWTPPWQADVVLCCEVFEHTPLWRQILKTMRAACAPGGTIIVTAAGPKRAPHSAYAVGSGALTEGEFYQNIGPDELAEAMNEAGIERAVAATSRGDEDVRAIGHAPVEQAQAPAPAVTLVPMFHDDPIARALAPSPFLSLCMIIKNGSRTLPALFESIKDIYDEIVIIDTGSTDDTRSLVLNAAGIAPDEADGDVARWLQPAGAHLAQPGDGAVVLNHTDAVGTRWVLGHFGWCDDFALARNFSFKQATGKWRMYLDHDDRLEYRGPLKHRGKKVNLKDVIKRLEAKNPRINVVSMPYDYVDGVVKEMKPRIMRWGAGFSWRFPIHEQIYLEAVDADVSVQSKGTRFSGQLDDLHVVHDKTLEEHEASAERNAEIITKALAGDVDDETHSHLLFHHALTLFQVGDFPAGDKILHFIEQTLESSTFWLLARRQRIQVHAIQMNDLPMALELAGGLYAHLPELSDGPNYIGWVHALRKNFPRAAEAFDLAQKLIIPYAYVEDRWVTEGAHVAARALAYAHTGRPEEARELLDRLHNNPMLRDNDAVFDLRIEADRVAMRLLTFRRLMDHVDALMWSCQPTDALAALDGAPANIRDLPQLAERRRHIKRLAAHLDTDEKYTAAYSAPSDKYHSYDHNVLLTERALQVIDWAQALDKDGPPVYVLSIGSHDALIEEVILQLNERLVVTVCDVSENASGSTAALKEKFPGRVASYTMSPHNVYDWGEGTFDVVMFFEVLEHVPDADQAMKVIRRRLDTGGQLFLSTPMADRWVERHLAAADRQEAAWHVRGFTGYTMWKLMRQYGFTGSIVEGRDGTLVFAGTQSGSAVREVVEIVIPMTPVPFDAVSPEQGFLGGSEESVVRLSRALATMGHDVTVYAPEKRRDGARIIAWEGVLWRSSDEFDAGAPRGEDTGVVFWRCPQQVAQYAQVMKDRGEDFSYKKFLWTHDARYQATREQYDAVDQILTLSDHHNRCLEKDSAPPEKFRYFPNGVDAVDFPEPDEGERDLTKVIYASSPDRGLGRILSMWDNVHAACPTATLDIYYAWDLAKKLNPKVIADFEKRIEELKDKGVKYHGGIDQPSLHDAYRRSGVWAYPNSGAVETFCISAVKAMAAGAWPVATNAGALAEVIDRHGTIIPEGQWELFEKALIRALLEPATAAQRKKAREYALDRFSWAKTAKRLIEYIGWKGIGGSNGDA